MWKIWLILAGIFLIIEIISVGFLVFWFSIGALIAMVASFFIPNTIAQTAIFVISSTILLFATKPLVKKILPGDVKTNSFSIIGKIAKVTIDIEPVEGKGQVKIGAEAWSAKSVDDTFIAKDTEVEILEIDGVKAIVKPLIKD
ncbi:MAG: NfeD family protein [Clostridia bacterium]|nr:NfeD family protein [Clostridia bacterium]